MLTGSGVAVSEQRRVSTFSAIEVDGAFDVVAVCQAAEQSVEVSGDDNIVPLIETRVDGQLLRIFSDQSFSTRLKMQVHVATANVEKVHQQGSGSVALSQVANESLELNLSGSGSIAVTGHTKVATVSVSGSGLVAAESLEAEDVDVTVTGSGAAQVRASSHLVAVATGSGEIRYSGNPRSVRPTISGSGSI